jgi:hypothetical protein
MIDVAVWGPSGAYDFLGRVDTGADDVLLPDFSIQDLGLTGLSEHIRIEGIGGISFVRYGLVDLEIREGAESLRWSARVGFYSGLIPVFGLKGFLQHFTARFNGRRNYLDLVPNGTAPHPRFAQP